MTRRLSWFDEVQYLHTCCPCGAHWGRPTAGVKCRHPESCPARAQSWANHREPISAFAARAAARISLASASLYRLEASSLRVLLLQFFAPGDLRANLLRVVCG